MKVLIEYLHEGMPELVRKHTFDAGADIPIWQDTVVKHGKNVIPLGFKVHIPMGYAGFLSPRSSVMAEGLSYNMVPIDTDYKGEVHLCIFNPYDDFVIKKGERLAQLMILPVLVADFVTDLGTRRGENGLGSTGK